VRGSPEPANRQRIPAVALFTAAGKGLNSRSSQHWGGEDVHQRPKGVNALLFGCSERAGRWRGGLPLVARLGGNCERVFRRVERRAGGVWTQEARRMMRGPRHSIGGFKTQSDSIQMDSKILKLI
jgi:hypothetical protein